MEKNLEQLPLHLRALETEPAYPVTVAPALHRLAEHVDRTLVHN